MSTPNSNQNNPKYSARGRKFNQDEYSHLTDYDSDTGAKFGVDGAKITAVRQLRSVGNCNDNIGTNNSLSHRNNNALKQNSVSSDINHKEQDTPQNMSTFKERN